MSTDRFTAAMGYIDDDLVSGAVEYKRTKKKTSWLKWGAIAACLCLVVVGAFTMFPYENWTEYQADDPNWPLTHFETAELSEIEEVCGTVLLLDKIALSGDYHSEYILEITEEGDFKNTDLWSNLSVSITNGEDIHDQSSVGVDYAFCFISFDGSTDGIHIMDFLNEAVTVEINGYTVEYNEMSTDEVTADGLTLGSKLDYHGWAKFTHNGYEYYIATNSDNPDFFEMTLEQLLK